MDLLIAQLIFYLNMTKTKTKEKIFPREIAESFINGNLSWVKNQCKKNIPKIAEILNELGEIDKKEQKRFLDWMLMW
jgi:hypothetical protein